MKKILTAVAAVCLVACNDHWDDFTPHHEETTAQQITFAASVSPSTNETRADGSIVNRLETSLHETRNRPYFGYNNEGVWTTKYRQYFVGVYGVYTGNNTWAELMQLDPRTDDVSQFSANFMYNQPMTIQAPSATNRSNTLNYYSHTTTSTATPTDSLIRFWPTGQDADGHAEKLSFWAYYPYNPTVSSGAQGEHGIHVNTSATGVGEGGGMGRVQFTMNPDASEQSDLMISELVADCSKDDYPLLAAGNPRPVQFRFHHMLAQVRLYAFIRGTDKMVYQKDEDGNDIVANEAWLAGLPDGETKIADSYGNLFVITKSSGSIAVHNATKDQDITAAAFVALGLYVPDEEHCVRWQRLEGDDTVWDVTGARRRADISYSMSFNNIYTSCIFTPVITYNEATQTYTTRATHSDAGALGSATVNHYIMNPYWFRFKPKVNPITGEADPEAGRRVMLNETYMYDYFESTPAARGVRSADADDSPDGYDGIDWSSYKLKDGVPVANPLGYVLNDENADPDYTPGSTDLRHKDYNTYPSLHFNYPEGNILMVVPQELNDDNAPNICITATGVQVNREGEIVYVDAEGHPVESTAPGARPNQLTAKVTINMLKMNIKWESGFIYCYAFVDELMPGDDRVRGPETITVLFNPERNTDQW